MLSLAKISVARWTWVAGQASLRSRSAALQFATAADPEQRKVLRKALLAALSALEEDEDR
jgi:hypothetical protein